MSASSRHEHDHGFQKEFQRVLDSGSIQIPQKERPLLLPHIDESKEKLKSYHASSRHEQDIRLDECFDESKLKSYQASSRHEQGISFQQEFQRVLDSESFQIQQSSLLPHIEQSKEKSKIYRKTNHDHFYHVVETIKPNAKSQVKTETARKGVLKQKDMKDSRSHGAKQANSCNILYSHQRRPT